MKESSRRRLIDLIRPYSHVHFYAAQPGALAMLLEAEPVVRGSGRDGAWFADGWAAQAGRRPDRPPEQLPAFTPPGGAACLVLGTQTTHQRTRQVISWCRRQGVATLFVFDAWKNQAEPFLEPDGTAVFPDVILVPDDLALAGLKAAFSRHKLAAGPEAEGGPPRLVVAGHWDIEGAAERLLRLDPGEIAALKARLNPEARPTILLLLDPVPAPEEPDLGYTALDVLNLLAACLPARHPGTRLLVKPHPREDRTKLEPALALWRARAIDHILVEGEPGPLTLIADQVWGMTSSALLIAREAGRPIRSLQPHRNAAGRLAANPHLEAYLLDLNLI